MIELSFDEYRYLWNLVTRKQYLTHFPLHLDIELSSLCNLKCEMCFQNSMGKQKKLMEMSQFKRIIDEGASNGLCAIKLQSRGEAFLHPEIIECIHYAKTRGILDVQVTTNGLLLLKNRLIAAIVNSGLDLLIISYDTYHAQGADMAPDIYDAFMMDLVESIRREKNKQNSLLPRLRIQSCIDGYEINRAAAYEKKLHEMFPDMDQYLVNPVYNSAKGCAHLPNLSAYKLLPCAYPWQRIVIFSDLSVTTCCYDYDCEFNQIGDLENGSIMEAWHSSAMNAIRNAHLHNERGQLPLCGKCHNYAVDQQSGAAASPSTPVRQPFD